MSSLSNNQVSGLNNSDELRATKSGLLFDTSFSKFQWDKLEELTLHDCRKDIQPSMLRRAKETITTLEFVGSTNFKNLKLLLQQCKNLEILTLFNITLLKYPSILSSSSSGASIPNGVKEEIKLPALVQLSMNGLGPLTQNEQQLLTYFVRQCQFPNLKTVLFELRQSRGYIYNELNSLNGGDPDSPILSEFLAKIRSSLKNLILERTAVSLHNNTLDNHSSSTNSATADKLRSIRLQELTCSIGTVGIDKILCSQRELETLNCYSSPYARICHFESVVDAIQRSASSLQAIRLSHKVIFNDSDISLGNVPSAVAHNCEIYKDCSNLCHISLSLSIFSDPARSRMKPGALTNLHLLPKSLKTIILRFDVFPAEQIDFFVNSLPEFTQLGLLLATGNPEMPFTVTVKWIQALVSLPNMATFEFNHCLAQNEDELRSYVNSSESEICGRVEIGPDSIVYRKQLI